MRTNSLLQNVLNLACLWAAMFLVPAAPAQVTFEWATVGNPGNAADPLNSDAIPGIGSVAYVYRIAKHEVTNDQYAQFLNAVAATDANLLYASDMGANARGGITRSGVSGSFTYSVKANMGNKPVNYVSFFDAMRFTNWLHNGQPTGAQDASTTESGVYAISDGLSESRAADALFFVPTENEWYKAAYHQPATNGGDATDYWVYPTAHGFSATPTVATANAAGDISNPGANVANYDFGADWNGQNGNVTTVGSAELGSESYYGTSDQGGNLWEWNEGVRSGSFRVLRGGSWNANLSNLWSSVQAGDNPTVKSNNFGFRVACPAAASLPVGTCCISNGGSCDAEGNCQENITQTECETLGGSFLGPNISCATACVNGQCIPTVSHWGLLALTLVLLATGTIALRRRTATP